MKINYIVKELAGIGCLVKTKVGNNYLTGVRAGNLLSHHLLKKISRASLFKQHLFQVLIKKMQVNHKAS